MMQSDFQVAFYALLAYFATFMGTNSVAAHQVNIRQPSAYYVHDIPTLDL